MAHFKYTALSRDGAKVTGMIDGFDQLDAAARIKENCDVIIKLTQVQEKEGGLFSADLGANHLNTKAFAVMCSQFAIILEAGLPIARAVRLVSEKTTDKNLVRVLKKVTEDVEGGRSLSAAFEDQGKKLLPPDFFEMLRAGEATGDLPKAFKTMQLQYEKQVAVKKKVKSAMSYPAFVLVIAIVVVAFLMAKVVPKFTAMFVEMGSEEQLPGITKSLIHMSDFFKDYLWFIVGGLIVIILVIRLLGAGEKGRLRMAKVKLKLPILGKIEMLSTCSQFASSMAGMMGAGLTMDHAVQVTSKVVSNYYMSLQTESLGKQLEAGRTLGASMHDLTDYPDILVDMTTMGESSGEMEKTMTSIARYYDSELDEAVQAALGKLEPALLIGMAVIAGYIVIAIYMAIFSLYGAMGAM